MASSDFLSELAAEAGEINASAVPTEEGSIRLRKLAVEMVEAERDIARMEREILDRKERFNRLRQKELPDLMVELRQDKIGLPDAGPYGADITMAPYYHANIANDWEPERRQAAFDMLDRKGDGDLVKNVLTMQFPRGQDFTVKAFVTVIDSQEFWKMLGDEVLKAGGNSGDMELPGPAVEKTVPWNTLTAYVKEQVEQGTLHEEWMAESDPVVDPIAVLGATVGTVAKIKFRKG